MRSSPLAGNSFLSPEILFRRVLLDVGGDIGKCLTLDRWNEEDVG